MIRKITTLGFAALAFLTTASHGAIVLDSETFGPLPPGTPAFTVALDKFNPALGTLLSVTLVLDLRTAGSSFTFDNESAAPGPVTLTFAVTGSATTGGPSILAVNTTVSKTGSGFVTADEPADGSGDFAGPDSFSLSGAGIAQNFTIQTAPAFLSQYTATVPGETFLVSIANSNMTSTAAMFGNTSIVGGTFSGAVTVGYTYLLVPVPEAGTALWGACVAALSGFRRSRVRRA